MRSSPPRTARARATIALGLREAGYSRAIYMVSGELTRLLAERQRKIEAGQIVQIGVNAFTGEIGLTLRRRRRMPDHTALERDRIEPSTNGAPHAIKPPLPVHARRLDRAVVGGADTMEPTMELARAGGTVGEWTRSIVRVTRGRYTPPILGSRRRRRRPQCAEGVAQNSRRALARPASTAISTRSSCSLTPACRPGWKLFWPDSSRRRSNGGDRLEEDVDVLAISSLAGAHMTIAREDIAMLAERGNTDISLVMGGIIPEADRHALLDLGVKAVFTPKDSNLGVIVGQIASLGNAAA